MGITENEMGLALQCWMTAGLEMARIVSEISVKHSPKLKCSYREQIPSIQSRFATNVQSVVDVFNE